MASEERKAADAKIEEDNLFLSLGAAEQQAETDAFQCGRCKQVLAIGRPSLFVLITLHQRKCRYRQAQTRSADEPMTVSCMTFRFCNCANKHITDLCNVRPVSLHCFYFCFLTNVQIVARTATTGGSSRRSAIFNCSLDYIAVVSFFS
jgi:DNA-directed RNA polymerase subunit M/transcription elongation factor TFIIS